MFANGAGFGHACCCFQRSRRAPGGRSWISPLVPDCLRTLVLLTLLTVVSSTLLESASCNLLWCLCRSQSACVPSKCCKNFTVLGCGMACLDMWGERLVWCSRPIIRGLEALRSSFLPSGIHKAPSACMMAHHNAEPQEWLKFIYGESTGLLILLSSWLTTQVLIASHFEEATRVEQVSHRKVTQRGSAQDKTIGYILVA